MSFENEDDEILHLRKQFALLTQALDQGPDPMMITDNRGMIEYVNSRFSELTGYTSEDVVGKNPKILSAGNTSIETYRELWDSVLSGHRWQGELCNRKKSGETFWESISIAPLKNPEGSVSHFVAVWKDVTEAKRRHEEMVSHSKTLEVQSIRDDLTGLYNRRYILLELEKETERSIRCKRPITGMMIDLDNFKQVNDQYGHPAGDEVLKQFALILEKSIRKMDIAGRYGGDEFLVLLPESDLEISGRVAERIRKNVHEFPFNAKGTPFSLSVSIGLIPFNEGEKNNKNGMIEKIDQALFRAKQSGKNQVAVG